MWHAACEMCDTMSASRHELPFAALPTRSAPALDLLAGVKVLDLTSSIAGPYAGQLLADMGATVLKVERPSGGDDARAWGPPFLHGESLWFLSVNRGKQSITLDFSVGEGLAVLHELAARSDVVLVNVVARTQRKLGIDAATLHVVNERLIHVSLTGFGLHGARADLPCYDLIAEGYSGVMDLTGEPDGPPQKVGTPAADLLAGQDAALAILAALFRRERDGKGCAIDVSMIHSMSRFIAPRLLPYLGSGELSRRSGGRDSVIAVYQAFETADEPLTLGLGNEAIWRRFWEAVGRPEVGAKPEFASNARRRACRAEVVALIASILRTKPRAHWLDLFAHLRVPAGPIYRLDQLADDPELRETSFIYRVNGPDGPIPQVGLGIRFDGRSEGTGTPPPKLGANTEQILCSWLDYDAKQVSQLRARHII